jgi:hypothetical protein
MLVRTDFQTRLATAQAGEKIIYYTGDLMFAREPGSQLDATANAAWDEHLAGRCLLVQHKLDAWTWEYIAIRTRDSSRKPEYTGAYEKDFLEGREPRMGRGYVSNETRKGRVLQKR